MSPNSTCKAGLKPLPQRQRDPLKAVILYDVKRHVPASESAQVGPAAIRSRAFLHSGSIKLKRVRKPIEINEK